MIRWITLDQETSLIMSLNSIGWSFILHLFFYLHLKLEIISKKNITQWLSGIHNWDCSKFVLYINGLAFVEIIFRKDEKVNFSEKLFLISHITWKQLLFSINVFELSKSYCSASKVMYKQSLVLVILLGTQNFCEAKI